VRAQPVNMSDAQANEAEKNIEIWKVKKLIKRLEAARGNGTSMISLIIRKEILMSPSTHDFLSFLTFGYALSSQGSGVADRKDAC
jgi:hypothetical protein